MVLGRFYKVISGLLLLGAGLPTAAFSQSDDSIVLEDGPALVLDNVWTPYELFWNDPEKQTEWQRRFREGVSDWMARHEYVALASGPNDRYGRRSGDLLASDGSSLRFDLMAEGLVVAEIGGSFGANERPAREPGQERGLWVGAFSPQCHQLAAGRVGNFAIIVGQIKNAAVVGRILYLNFGADWREDFTVSKRITRGEERPDTESLTGTWIEARGWVEWRGGPAIIIRDWSQVTPLAPDDPQKEGCG